MTQAEKENVANAILYHFPQATPGDAQLIGKLLDGIDPDTISLAIAEHRRELGANVFRPSPDRIAMIARQKTDRGTQFDRTRDYMRDQDRHDQEVVRIYAKIDADLANLNDAKLDELKTRVLETCDERIRPVVARSNPRTSKLLRPMIVAFLKSLAEVAR